MVHVQHGISRTGASLFRWDGLFHLLVVSDALLGILFHFDFQMENDQGYGSVHVSFLLLICRFHSWNGVRVLQLSTMKHYQYSIAF